MYDTVSQYDQVLSGDVEDWHPPVMVRLWQLLLPLRSGTDPMFVLQVALYALGFALIIGALVRNGRAIAGAAVALLALSPLILGWQMVVLKDGQMLGSLIAALGTLAHFRLRNVRVPLAAIVAVIVLIAYATLLRVNAVFATVPLSIFLLRRPSSVAVRAGLAILTILLLLGLEPVINHRLFDARPSGIAKSQPLFDLAAIAVVVPRSVPPFTPAERSQLVRRHCVKAFFWDPIGDPGTCGPVTDRANALSERELDVDLARAAASHPLAYFEHRVRHWNSTERWLVPPGLIDAAPPRQAEPNEEGLASPASELAPSWQDAAAFEAQTPLGWPITWTAVALLLLPVAWGRRAEDEGSLALALLASALTLEASFLVISIASDLRYHLWSMVATPLALIFLGNNWPKGRKSWLVAGIFLTIVIAGGIFTRETFPRAPNGYQAMLHAPTG